MFRLLPDRVNVVPIDEKAAVQALTQSIQVLAAYPGMGTERGIAELIGSVTFKTAKALGNEVCGKRNETALTFVPAVAAP